MSLHKWIAYLIGFALGCVILIGILRNREPRELHPWHAQTAPDGYYPLEVTDAYGRTMTIQRQPRHLISLAPSVTEILFAMDMGDHLVAVSQWCDTPDQARALRDAGAHVGAMDRPDRERMAQYHADLILGTTLTPPEIYPLLENPPRAHAIAFRHETMEEILSDIRTIGRVLGVPGHAVRLLKHLQQQGDAIDKTIRSIRAATDAPSVLFLLSIENDLQPGWAPGAGTWIDDLLSRSGATNAAAKLGKSWGAVSFESLLALDPGVLIVRDAASEAERAQLARDLAALPAHPVWSNVRAVRDNRVHVVPYGPLNIPGPRLMEAYRSVAGAVWNLDAATAGRRDATSGQ